MHLESLICYACQTSQDEMNLFDDKHRRPIVGICGHSICLTCSRSEENRKCPICAEPDAFIHRTVNYEVMAQMELYKKNAFTTFRKWWETLTTGVGVCSKCASVENLRICLTCQKAQNLKEQDVSSHIMCPSCAGIMIGISSEKRSDPLCNSKSVLHMIRKLLPVRCYKCEEETDDPRICEKCFHDRTATVNLDTFSVCADCILEHHGEHETTKAVQEYGIRHCTMHIVGKLLFAKLDCLTEQKCKLRKMRLDYNGVCAVHWSGFYHPVYPDKNCPETHIIGPPILHEHLVKRIIDCLEDQYKQLEELEETCECVEVYKDIKRLNLLNVNLHNPHFEAICLKLGSQLKIDRCPFDLECNQEWKRQLLEIIERNEVATKPLESIAVMDDEGENAEKEALSSRQYCLSTTRLVRFL